MQRAAVAWTDGLLSAFQWHCKCPYQNACCASLLLSPRFDELCERVSDCAARSDLLLVVSLAAPSAAIDFRLKVNEISP